MPANTIHLRPPTRTDMEFIRQIWSDPDTMNPVGGPIFLTDERVEQWFKTMIQPGRPTDYYCLIFNECHCPVGEISYHHLDFKTMTAEFNIKIVHGERGHGYAPAAMHLFMNYFFNQIGGQMLVDDVALENYRGQQVLLKFGFEQDVCRTDVCRLILTCDRFNHLDPKC